MHRRASIFAPMTMHPAGADVFMKLGIRRATNRLGHVLHIPRAEKTSAGPTPTDTPNSRQTRLTPIAIDWIRRQPCSKARKAGQLRLTCQWRRGADLNRRDPSFRACFRPRSPPTSRCHHEWSCMVLSFHSTPVDESSRASTYVRIRREILTYVKSPRRENLRSIPWKSLQPVLKLRGEQSTAAAPP
jgi:hypothetical protein